MICGFVTFGVVVGKANDDDDEEPEGAVDNEEGEEGEIDVFDGHFGFRRGQQHLASPCLSSIEAKKIISE